METREIEARLMTLEAVARRLELSEPARRELLCGVGDYAQAFVNGLDDAPTYVADDGASRRLGLEFPEQGGGLAPLLQELQQCVDTAGINPASGGHLGYIPGGGIYPSALGDFMADVTNRYSGVAFASPGAVRMEQGLIEWMARLFGLPSGAGGDLTSGGSMANLTALVSAREAQGIRARDISRSPVYLTAQAHHCVDKALRVGGMGECPRRIVPMDQRFRMDPHALQDRIRADREQGLRPWLVVASAGTTDTGAVDPVPAIAEVARREGLWLHVDAAYGGFFVLCEEGRAVLRGLEQADSIVVDPHKGLFLPYGSGAVLVKNVHDLARAHGYEANYMQDAREAGHGYSPADLSPELTRPFRGLRLWLPLRLYGLAPFRAALAEKLWLARYFHRRIAAIPGFVAGPEPELSVVTYRYAPERGDPDACNRHLLQEVMADGKVFISSTRIEGRFTLRLAVLHYRTHLDTVDYLLNLLADRAARLGAGAQPSP